MEERGYYIFRYFTSSLANGCELRHIKSLLAPLLQENANTLQAIRKLENIRYHRELHIPFKVHRYAVLAAASIPLTVPFFSLGFPRAAPSSRSTLSIFSHPSQCTEFRSFASSRTASHPCFCSLGLEV
jgi:hypothetical protein